MVLVGVRCIPIADRECVCLSVHVSGTSIAYEGLEPIDTLFIVVGVGDVVSYSLVFRYGWRIPAELKQ